MPGFSRLFDDDESPDTVPEEDGKALAVQSDDIITTASKLIVSDEKTYKQAASMIKTIKRAKDKITGYWEPLVKKAYASYKELGARKKEMLEGLETADTNLRAEMSKWTTKIENDRKEEEQRRLKLADEERQLLMDAASKEEANGRYSMATELRETAESIPVPAAKSAATKISGIGYRTVCDIEVIDEDLVPDKLNDVLIRPVDLAPIRKLLAMYPNLKIPGIKIMERQAPIVR